MQVARKRRKDWKQEEPGLCARTCWRPHARAGPGSGGNAIEAEPRAGRKLIKITSEVWAPLSFPLSECVKLHVNEVIG